MAMQTEVARPPGGGLCLLPHEIYHVTRLATSLAPAAATTLGGPVVRMRTTHHELYDGSMVAPRGVPPATSPVAAPATAGGGPRVARMPIAPHEFYDGSMVAPRGVPAAARAVAGLPRTTTVAAGGGGSAACVVCLEGYAVGDAVRTMPCAHAFHEGCIVEWLSVSPLCPLCRFRLPTQAEEDAAQSQQLRRRLG